MQIFWWLLGLATAWGLLRFFRGVQAIERMRKEGLRLSRELAEGITTNGPEPIEWELSDISTAAVENRAVPEEDRKAA